jgi:CHASE1-domain containing sensor protein
MTTLMKKLWSMWVVIAIGLTVTIIIVVKVYSLAVIQDRQLFIKETQEQSKVLEKYLIDSFRSLDSIDAFFQSSQFIDRKEFAQFSAHLIRNYPYIQAVEWVPRVTFEQRNQFELSARNDGLEGFQFTELDAKGVIIPARPRKEYFPVYYADPIDGNQYVMGYDMNSEPIRRELLQESVRSGRPILSQGINLTQSQELRRDGLLAVKPVFQKQQGETLYNKPTSFVIVVLKLGALIETAFENEKTHHMDLSVYDITNNTEKEFLYSYGSGNSSRQSGIARMAATATIKVGGRVWEIQAIPQNVFILFRHWELIFVLITGFGVTFTFAGFLYMQRRREQIIEKKIDERTAQLSDVNDKLRTEIVLRRKAEELTRNKVLMTELINNAISRADEINSHEDLMKLCLDVISRLISWPIGFVYEIIPKGNEISVRCDIWHCDQPNNFAKLIEVCTRAQKMTEEKPFCHVLTAKKAQWAKILLEDHSESRKQALVDCEIKMALLIPIIVFKGVPVVLEFFSSEAFSPDREMLLLLQSFIEQIGHNMERKESEHKFREEKERLQLFQNVTVTREMEIIELKKENNELHRRLGAIPPYDLSFLEKPWSSVKKLEAKDESRGSAS